MRSKAYNQLPSRISHRALSAISTAARVASCVLALCILCPAMAWSAPLRLTVHTSPLSGMAGQLAFDLIDGGAPANTARIAGFTSDGTLGAIRSTGAVSGQLTTGLVLSDDQFFNEYLQDFVFGTGFAFSLDTTGRPGAGMTFPDAVALFLLDPASGQSLLSTSDPTGANALFLLSIGASPQLEIYQVTGLDVSVQLESLPEPATLLLLAAGLAAAALCTAPRRTGRAIQAGPHAWHGGSRRQVAALCITLLAVMCCAEARATDVTATTDIKRSGLVLNRSSNTYDSVVTVTNLAQQSYAAPLRLIVQVTPSSVSLANGTGVLADGRAYVDIPLPAGRLNQGQSVRTTIKLHNLPQVPFTVGLAVDAATAEPPGLPPDPGPAGDIPLPGIDTDRDGVRDDLQRYIALTYPAEPNAVQALRELSRTYQAMLSVPSGAAAEAKTVNLRAWRNRACLVYLYGAVEGHRRAQALFAEQFNTLARYRAWSQQDDLLAGEVFESPPNSAANCDFAVNR